MPGHHRRANPRRNYSRLFTIMLAAGIFALVAASVYIVLTRGKDTGGNAQATPTPTPVSTAVSTASCHGTRNTPGGPDPWGGCWPGPNNTGPQAGIVLTPYVGPDMRDGACTITTDTVIADKMIACSITVESGNLTLEDSSISGEVYNYGSGTILIKDTTINGGSAQTETVGGSNITIENSNLYGNQHEVYCGHNCTVENSWLHNNHNGDSLGWHQNGFLSTGGSHYNLEHNSVYCVGGCTSDIGFIPNDNVSNATVHRNLLVATSYAAYCLYPSSDSPGKPGTVSGMVVTDNVFQRGANGKCAGYGPVYGWDTPNNILGTSGYHNVWAGNIWNDGKVLAAP